MLPKTRKEKVLHTKNKLQYDLKYNGALIVMLIIPLLLLIIFQYFPLYGIQIAFKDYNPIEGIRNAEWVGLKYFKKFFSYYDFGKLLKNTVLLNSYDILLTPIPLIYALCINYFPNKKIKNMIQTIAITPHFISTVVVCGLAMRFLSVNGALNEFLTLTGKEPVNFLAHGEYFRSIYVWSGVWQNVGFSAIIYISALAEVSKDQHEAASIDGANIIQKIWYIDLPNVFPLFCVNLIFRCGSLLSNNYEKVLLFQNNVNMEYSQVISTYSYEIAFKGLVPQYSLSMAIGLVTSVVNVVMLLLVKRLTRRWEKVHD